MQGTLCVCLLTRNSLGRNLMTCLSKNKSSRSTDSWVLVAGVDTGRKTFGLGSRPGQGSRGLAKVGHTALLVNISNSQNRLDGRQHDGTTQHKGHWPHRHQKRHYERPRSQTRTREVRLGHTIPQLKARGMSELTAGGGSVCRR